ncbi:MAG: PIN domain-containing protein [Firmicutes bacterium]|nr:PIN domain-containing protein [Bacillota bacterium]
MGGESWPRIRASRLGTGVVLDGQVVLALRIREDPNHERVLGTVGALVRQRLPLVVSSLSLYEAARRMEAREGPRAALLLWRQAGEVFNIVFPTGEDLAAAEEFLSQELPEVGLEQAVIAVLARRLGCSVYGLSPIYHLLHLPVLVD